MKKKYVILFVLAIVLIAILVWPRGNFKIASVEDGNTVVLDNGATVHLIGVYDTDQAKEYLEDNFLKTNVVLFSDASAPFNPNHLSSTDVVFAYVVQKSDSQCINATLIRMGLTGLNEDVYLTDSLKPFRKYYEQVRNIIE